MAVPTTYEEYLAQLDKNLSWFERRADSVSGVDERIDLTNRLLIENLKLLRAGLKLQLPPSLMPQMPPYNVLKFLLNTARPAPGEEVDLPGDMIPLLPMAHLLELISDWILPPLMLFH